MNITDNMDSQYITNSLNGKEDSMHILYNILKYFKDDDLIKYNFILNCSLQCSLILIYSDTKRKKNILHLRAEDNKILVIDLNLILPYITFKKPETKEELINMYETKKRFIESFERQNKKHNNNFNSFENNINTNLKITKYTKYYHLIKTITDTYHTLQDNEFLKKINRLDPHKLNNIITINTILKSMMKKIHCFKRNDKVYCDENKFTFYTKNKTNNEINMFNEKNKKIFYNDGERDFLIQFPKQTANNNIAIFSINSFLTGFLVKTLNNNSAIIFYDQDFKNISKSIDIDLNIINFPENLEKNIYLLDDKTHFLYFSNEYNNIKLLNYVSNTISIISIDWGIFDTDDIIKNISMTKTDNKIDKIQFSNNILYLINSNFYVKVFRLERLKKKDNDYIDDNNLNRDRNENTNSSAISKIFKLKFLYEIDEMDFISNDSPSFENKGEYYNDIIVFPVNSEFIMLYNRSLKKNPYFILYFKDKLVLKLNIDIMKDNCINNIRILKEYNCLVLLNSSQILKIYSLNFLNSYDEEKNIINDESVFKGNKNQYKSRLFSLKPVFILELYKSNVIEFILDC